MSQFLTQGKIPNTESLLLEPVMFSPGTKAFDIKKLNLRGGQDSNSKPTIRKTAKGTGSNWPLVPVIVTGTPEVVPKAVK